MEELNCELMGVKHYYNLLQHSIFPFLVNPTSVYSPVKDRISLFQVSTVSVILPKGQGRLKF